MSNDAKISTPVSAPGFAGRKYMILIAVTFVIVAIDQLTKMMVHGTFELGESIRIIESYFNLTYVRNTGAAFGIFGQSHPTFRQLFFLSIPPIAVFIIVMFMRNLTEKDKVEIYALSLISGGAIGNYIDRLRFGYVVDFLDFHWQDKYSWPAFNVADMAIVIGPGPIKNLIAVLKKKLSRQE
jgi:signal peptidase II